MSLDDHAIKYLPDGRRLDAYPLLMGTGRLSVANLNSPYTYDDDW